MSRDDLIKIFIAPIIPSIIGGLIALGGVHYTLLQQENTWASQILVDEFIRITNKRAEIISQMADALTSTQRAQFLEREVARFNKRLELEQKYCYDDAIRIQNERVCKKLLDDYFDTADYYSQQASMQSAFLKSVLLASLYFCEETKAVLKSIQGPDKPWWEIDTEQQGLLLRAMQSEMRCNLETAGLLE